MIDPDCQLQGRSSAPRIHRRGRLRANHEADTPGAKGSFNLLVQPEHLANRFKDATAGVRHSRDDHGHGKRRPQCDQGLSLSRRKRCRHGRQRAPSRGNTGRTPSQWGEAEVTKVDGRQIEFAVRAIEGAKEIGVGSHSRVVIDVAKFVQRLG